MTLTGLTARLFGLHLAGREEDDDDVESELVDEEGWGWKEEVYEIKGDVARALGVSLEGKVRI